MTQSSTPVDVPALRELLAQYGLVITDDPDFDHDEATFDRALRALLDELTTLRQQAGNGVPEQITDDDHPYSLTCDDADDDGHVITQTRYYRWGDCLIAIGELNTPNVWDDDAFDHACGLLASALTASPQPPEPTVSSDAPEKVVAAGPLLEYPNTVHDGNGWPVDAAGTLIAARLLSKTPDAPGAQS